MDLTKRIRELHWQSWPVSLKLTILMISLVVISIMSVTILSIRREQDTFRTELEQQATLVLDLLQAAVEDDLYFLDADNMSDMLEKMGHQQGFLSSRIYSPEGYVIADAFSETVTGTVDQFAIRLIDHGEYVNHDDTIFIWESDRLTSGRHIHIGNQQLGAISVSLSTDSLTPKIISTRNQGIAVALIAVFFGSTTGLLLSRTITQPLQQLASASKRFAAGDMSRPIQVNSQDEIGRLAETMELMRSELSASYGNLEQQVVKRTHELVMARDEALESSRIKSELLARSSHELRTPLNAILGYTEMLEDGIYGDITSDQMKATSQIIRSTHRMTALVGDLLDQAHLEAGRMKLEIEPFSPRLMIEKAQLRLKSLAANKKLGLYVNIAPDMPELILGDMKRIDQIIVNLVGNAIKFTDKGAVTIQLFLSGRTHWVLSVGDTGIGIPDELQEVIFDPFRQVDGSMTRTQGGTGLGLSIVRDLTTLMAAEIELESRLGQGSTFAVSFPLQIVSPESNDSM